VVSKEAWSYMKEDLLTHLEAMYYSGEVTEFISARMPSEKLTIGWMEQGLLRKGFAGKLQDKKNQEELVIPSDRFARLTRNLERTTDTFVGLLILGRRGLKQSKFCTLVYKSSDEIGESFTSVAFWTRNLNTKEIATIIARHLLSRNFTGKNGEVDLDYIERLTADTASGVVQNLLSLDIKQDKMNVADWIRDAVKNAGASKKVISCYGNLGDLSKTGLLFSRWLAGLELFKKTKENLAAIFMTFDDRIDSCLWDTRQNIATFASLRGINLEEAIDRYLSPMWASPEDLKIKEKKTPEVVIGKQTRPQQALQKSTTESHGQSASVSLSQIRTRIDALEVKVQQMNSRPIFQTDNLEQSLMIVQTRITDVLDRLETLATQLEELENRLKTASKGGR
jgi:hypothetical protein